MSPSTGQHFRGSEALFPDPKPYLKYLVIVLKRLEARASWGVWGGSWRLLAASWDVFGPSWEPLGTSWSVWAASWDVFGPSWEPLEPA